MKRIVAIIATFVVAQAGFAQTDTTKKESPDTVKVGNFIIIKKNKDGDSSSTYERTYSHNGININIGNRNNTRHNSAVSTNWFIFDLGFANFRDETLYGSADAKNYLHTNVGDPAFSENDFKLRTGKSSNANLWLFMQKLNVTKHVVNLKYGLGLEMYNYRYETNVTYHKNPAYIFRDNTKSFSKNKLYAGYATVPFMLNIDATPSKKRGFSLSGGVSASYLVGSRNKQISDADGKQKIKGDIGLEKFKFAYIAELGLGPVRLYGSYSITPLHESGLKQYPYAFGLRFSNW
jgi:hypothetical protein